MAFAKHIRWTPQMSNADPKTTARMPQHKLDGWDLECVICGCKWMEEADTECPQCAMKDKPPVQQATSLEVRRDEDGSLDEIVATGASIHLEQMGGNSWWMSIEAGGRHVHVNLTTPRTVINARCEDVG